jgi:hypothetical protein
MSSSQYLFNIMEASLHKGIFPKLLQRKKTACRYFNGKVLILILASHSYYSFTP